jgi:CheY-like chemotaxis protein
MDGWDVLRRLKADPALRDIPVVIVTVVEEREVGLALGAVDYLVKPIEREALLAILARLQLQPAAPRTALRVLAVDDEPAALSAIEAVLGPAGFEVTRALGGRQGVALATRDQPDLVICDLVMPDLDGFGVVGALRADPQTRDIPILILTGHDLTRDDKQRLAGKVMAIVEKGTDAQAGLRAWLARSHPAIGRA